MNLPLKLIPRSGDRGKVEVAQVIAWTPLGELLVERGLLTEAELESALAEQVESGGLLGAILIERRVVTGAALTTILAEQAGIQLEIEPGFGSGLFAKLAARDGVDEVPVSEPPPRQVSEPQADTSASPAVTRPADPAFELIRLRSELERERARVAELEDEIATLRAGSTRKRRADKRRTEAAE